MGLSGFLYVAIVVGWAVYLVPFALRRYDEAARARSVDRFSSAMRVLGRRAETAPVAGRLSAAGTTAAERTSRAAPRAAARRRRRVLSALLLVTAVTAGAAARALTEWWAAAVPAGLVLGWLVLCRVQVRRFSRNRATRTARGGDDSEAWRPSAQAVPAVPDTDGGDEADDEPTIELPRVDPDATASPYARADSLWDPVPVTLPTYVHKPRAPRTIRTIDLGSPSAQTSGRGEDSAIYTHRGDPRGAAQQEQPSHSGAASEPEPATDEESADQPARRAVGQ